MSNILTEKFIELERSFVLNKIYQAMELENEIDIKLTVAPNTDVLWNLEIRCTR